MKQPSPVESETESSGGLRVLVVEDEHLITASLSDALSEAGHHVSIARDGPEALRLVQSDDYDAVISDVRLPKMNGFELFERLRELQPETLVIFITAYANVQDAVRMIKAGAYDYLAKPFLNEDLLRKLENIRSLLSLRRENAKLKEELSGRPSGLVGTSPAMARVFSLIEAVSRSDCTVLIEGESGTGKSLVARAVHAAGSRRTKPFVAVSCSSIPETLLESEIFGHVRGAFTDAAADRVGRFQSADHGTIFIDDVDDLPLTMQVKLLRVLQERRFERLGDPRTIDLDVRVLAATKRDLWEMVRAGRFREDLYFRLNVVKIPVPPLRERLVDLPLLVDHFVRKYSRGVRYHVPPQLMDALASYPFPGNVRELENAVERAIVLASPDRILKPEHVFRSHSQGGSEAAGPLAPLDEIVARTEAEHIRRALQVVGGHRGKAAAALGIGRKELWLKMKKYGID